MTRGDFGFTEYDYALLSILSSGESQRKSIRERVDSFTTRRWRVGILSDLRRTCPAGRGLREVAGDCDPPHFARLPRPNSKRTLKTTNIPLRVLMSTP